MRSTNEERAAVLARMVTKDEAGKHFTERWPHGVLNELEEAGLIEIFRPVHKTGTPYSQEYWTVEVTQEGQNLVDTWPEVWPD